MLFSCSYKFCKTKLKVGKSTKKLYSSREDTEHSEMHGAKRQVCKNGCQNLNEMGRFISLWVGPVLGVMLLHLAGFCPGASSVSNLCYRDSVLHGLEVSSARYILPVN